jgi:hypothetical protein
MRISEDRYSRDLRRLNLAQRLIRHEVRTYWISAWTGLSHNRVRKLFRSYYRAAGVVQRHRGPSPTRLAAFLRSPTLRTEASAIGGLACVLGVLPPKLAPSANRDRQSVEAAAERLCGIFELYQHIVPQSHFTMDQFIRLTIALAEGQDLKIGHCENCHGALLLERPAASRRLCPICRQDLLVHPSADRTRAARRLEDPVAADPAEPPESYQQPLF